MLLKKLKALTVMAFAMVMVAGAVFVFNTSAVNAEDGQEFAYKELTFFFEESGARGSIDDVIREEDELTLGDWHGDYAGIKVPIYKIVVPSIARPGRNTVDGGPAVIVEFGQGYTFQVLAYNNYEVAAGDGSEYYTDYEQMYSAPPEVDMFDQFRYDGGGDGKPDVFLFKDFCYEGYWNQFDDDDDEEHIPPMFAVTFTTQAERTQELLNAAGDAEQLRTDLAKANLDLGDAIKELTQVRGDLTQALTDKETAETALKQAQGNAVTTLGKVSLKSAKGATKKVTVKWKKAAGAAGYEVVIAKNKAGTKNASIYTVKKVSTVTKTVKGLAKGKYFVKVRAYKTYKGNTLYGAFSAAKKVTVK